MSEGQAAGIASVLGGTLSQAASAAAGAAGTTVRAAIAQAAQATGVDFQYLMAQAKIESSLNPGARAATSSAAGLYQFTSGTWVDTLGKHAADHGMGWVKSAIQGGGMANAATRAQVMGLRYDPQVAAMMAAELTADNRNALCAQLGRQPDNAELYLAHFLGSAGAGQFLNALQTDPTRSAASVMPKAAQCNRAIFFSGGAPRSLADVMGLIRDKVDAASDVGSFDTFSSNAQLAYEPVAQEQAPLPEGGPIAREFAAAAAAPAAAPSRSMSETLASAFGTASTGAPAHVRDAYAKLARFGL